MLPGKNFDVSAHVGSLSAPVAVQEEACLQFVAALTGEEGHGDELQALGGSGFRQFGLEVFYFPHEDSVVRCVGTFQLVGELGDVRLLFVD